jgi:hypothetical protein
MAQRIDAAAEDEACYRSLVADGVAVATAAEIDRAAFERAAG